MSEQEIWEKVLEAAKLHISETSMNTFLKDSNYTKLKIIQQLCLLVMNFMLVGSTKSTQPYSNPSFQR